MVPEPKKEPIRVMLVGFHPPYASSLASAFRQVYGTAGTEFLMFSHYGMPLGIVNMVRPDVVIVWPEQIGSNGEAVMKLFLGGIGHHAETVLIGAYADRIEGCGRSHWDDCLRFQGFRAEPASTEEEFLALARSIVSGTNAQMA